MKLMADGVGAQVVENVERSARVRSPLAANCSPPLERRNDVFTRIGLMFVVVATLCGAAFTLGSRTSENMSMGGRQDASGLPAQHPVVLALRYRRELALTDAQIQKFTAMRDGMAKEFAPLQEQADAIQHRMQTLQQSGKPDPEAAEKLKEEGDALGAKMQPLFSRFDKAAGNLLTEDQRRKLLKLSNPPENKPDGQEFALDVIMRSRDELELTPPQFTQLQYLQADLIRAFAPLREKMEYLQLEIQDKFAKTGKTPTPEYGARAAEIQRQVAALQSEFSERAIRDVLAPKQRAKLEELMHGDHRPATR
jgi:Spy/CpxP family protein refolding chaperone